MKSKPMMIICGIALLILSSTWIPDVLAGVRSPAVSIIRSEPAIDFPLNRNCVVTVDPRSSVTPVIAGRENKVTGFSAPNTAEGVLIRLDSDWLVLRDNYTENWIPKDKVIMIHVTN